MAKSDMCANVNDSDISRLQRIFGPVSEPAQKPTPGRRAHRKSLNDYDQERRIAATYGCPCDACQYRATCIAPCDLCRTWITHGTTPPHRRRKSQ